MSSLQSVDLGVLVKDGPGDFQQLLALFGEDDAFVITDEKRAAELFFKFRDML